MAKSINQDIDAGGSKYHIQTEYYRSSGKIVTNIFKDGLSVKRIEKEVSPELSEEELDREIESFHNQVLSKLRSAGKRRKEREKGEKKVGLTVPKELYDRLLLEMSPFFGIASSFVLEEALEEAQSPSHLIEIITSDLPKEQKELLKGRLTSVIGAISSKEEETFKFTQELEDKILAVLSNYFGIMAAVILEDSLHQWKAVGGKTYEELVDLIAAHADSKEEEGKIKLDLMSL
ncbi:hypothetical protein [Thermovibrio sp.]